MTAESSASYSSPALPSPEDHVYRRGCGRFFCTGPAQVEVLLTVLSWPASDRVAVAIDRAVG